MRFPHIITIIQAHVVEGTQQWHQLRVMRVQCGYCMSTHREKYSIIGVAQFSRGSDLLQQPLRARINMVLLHKQNRNLNMNGVITSESQVHEIKLSALMCIKPYLR